MYVDIKPGDTSAPALHCLTGTTFGSQVGGRENPAQLKLDAGQASKVKGENQLAAVCVSPAQGKEKRTAH
jgi:hypothetical protein